MRSYKFLVMETNGEHSMFLNADLGGGGLSAQNDTNVTNFTAHDFGGGHQNDDYWNTPEELLVGFFRWYLRTEEQTAHHMGNRIYSATNTYRFFMVDESLGKQELKLANNDLESFEITERHFINNILNSWAWEQISGMFRDNGIDTVRTEPSPVEVVIVYNEETTTWCWISDYSKFEDEYHLELSSIYIPVGLNYEEAVMYISKDIIGCSYRFGGNDAYNKRKGLPL